MEKKENTAPVRPGNDTARRAVKYVIWIVVILLLTNPWLIPFLPASAKSMMTNAVSSLLGDMTQVSSVLRFNWVAVIQLVVMVLVLRLVHLVLAEVLTRLKPKSGRVSTVMTLLRSAQSYIFVLIGIFWGLSILGVDVATMLAGVGVVALVLGFGAESLIADVVTGIFMIFENEYNVGDVIEVGGFRGTVDSIGIRTTRLRDGGDNIKVLNNSDIRNLTNLSQRGSTAVCDLPIPYEADLKQARAALENDLLPAFVENHHEIFHEVPTLLGVQQLADSAVVLRIIAVVDENDRFAAERWMREDLKTGMEKYGMGCPYNRIVVARG